MRTKHVALLSLLLAAAAAAVPLLLSPASSRAQAQGPAGGPLKIGTASTQKIFIGMKEKADVEQRIKREREAIVNENRSRQQKVEDLRQQLELIKPDAPQYEEQSKAFMQAAIEHKNWSELTQAQAARTEKLQTKMLFEKISAVIAELAKEQGIDLVLAEMPPFAIERMNVQELQQAMAQRQVLYSNASVDLTSAVIQRLDERYNASKK